jgi:hypothetical protein
MKNILKWGSWIVSALALSLIFLGTLAYLLGNILVLGVRYGTYYYFGQALVFSAILLVLLNIACQNNKKE